MDNYQTSTTIAENHVHIKPTTRSTNGKGRPNVQLKDLPEGVLCTVLSNLPAKEAVRSSVLSSEWRSIWTTCSKLSFNGKDFVPRHGEKQHTKMFIDYIDAVLKKHHGKVVNNLEIKLILDRKLVYHLNNCIKFAMSSRTKNLAIDLESPSIFLTHRNEYRFPFELLDKESVSCLQCLQLSFVGFKPSPSQFTGFPNLRKFDLSLVNTTSHDLENILCNCCNLEWLSIVSCHLDNELKVVQMPLSHLQYLRVKYCRVTKIEFHAAKLHHASELENAEIYFGGSTFQHGTAAVLNGLGSTFQHGTAAVLNGLPHVQSLTLKISVQVLETTWTSDSRYMFPLLRHVQIILAVQHKHDDKILYLVSLLRAAPFVEHLEVHLDATFIMWFANKGPSRQDIPPSEHKYLHLKNMHLTGFKATKGQLQLLLHVVENAPAIETVTIDTIQRFYDVVDSDEILPALHSSALDIVRDLLCERLPPDAKLYLL